MSIRQQLRERFEPRPTYECGLCGLTFDDERQNCPACGYGVREASR
ncbi:hypothetical protein EGH21_04165 [Halomicroarcula sp. F13]|uniref:Rubrerythrin-like domain-containing protein n=1 Tax=Haloarcula rubra TaxID=2487747 RepID=A0AAW4PM60_9EURY|nr:hypothetical protein [Halomicroarcula rubra]MBX0322225.1 hypothetical protein [Halomicroarcula rubra]